MKLFVYGSLMNEEVLTSLLGCRFIKTKAFLADYKCLAVSGADYPAIRPERGSVVAGEVVEGLTPQQVRDLDIFEGEYYQRVPVIVVTEKNMENQCETYVFKPEYYNLLTNSGWCNKRFREKHMRAFLNG